MEPNVQVFWVPKDGNSLDEYEDAYGCDSESGVFAIADGATESSFADIWATLLTQKFVAVPPPYNPQEFPKWIEPLQKEWHANIMWDRLPWYAEEKARNGAFATLLGIRFGASATPEEEIPKAQSGGFFKKFTTLFSGDEEEELSWEAITIGDSNMFVIRGESLVKAWPVTKSSDFSSRPVLVSSNPKKNDEVWPTIEVTQGSLEPGDLFVLATDAIAAWFMAQCETGRQPWKRLLQLKDDDDYRALVAELRGKGTLKNDDTTIMLLHWGDEE